MNYIDYFEGGKSLPELSSEKQVTLDQVTKLYEQDKPLSGTDPVGAFIVSNIALGKPAELAFKGLATLGKKAAPYLTKGFNHLRQTIKAKTSPSITERFLKLVGSDGSTNAEDLVFDLGEEQLKLLSQQLEARGIDMSKVTKSDLQKALDIRQQQLLKTGPKRKSIVTPDELQGNSKNTITDYINNKPVGETITLKGSDPYLHIGNVVNIKPNAVHGVQERGLNSAAQIADDLNMDGVIISEWLKMPEISTSVYKHFPNKKLIRNNGYYEWATGTTNNNPVYIITEPAKPVPTKSIIFDPIIINKNGKLRTKWKDKRIFRTIAPAILGAERATSVAATNQSND